VTVLRDALRAPGAADHLTCASITTFDPQHAPGAEVNFDEVRMALDRLALRFFNLQRIAVDQGAESAAILPWLRQHPRLSLRAEAFTATVATNMTMWSALSARLHATTISLPPHARLVDELRSLRVEELASGRAWRVTDSTKKLHRDVSMALAGAVMLAGAAGSVACDIGEVPADAAVGFFGKTLRMVETAPRPDWQGNVRWVPERRFGGFWR